MCVIVYEYTEKTVHVYGNRNNYLRRRRLTLIDVAGVIVKAGEKYISPLNCKFFQFKQLRCVLIMLFHDQHLTGMFSSLRVIIETLGINVDMLYNMKTSNRAR